MLTMSLKLKSKKTKKDTKSKNTFLNFRHLKSHDLVLKRLKV